MIAFLKFLLGLWIIIAIGIVSVKTQFLPGSLLSAEHRLQLNSENALSALEAPWASVRLDGQKAVLTGEAPNAAAMAEAATAIARAEWRGGLVVGGVTAVDLSAVSFDDTPPIVGPNHRLAEVKEAESKENISRAQPVSEPEIMSESVAISVNAETCANQFRTLISDQHITFAYARNSLGPISRAYLADIADLLSECPEIVLELSGHSDSSGNQLRNLRLSLRRAETAASHLRSIGVNSAQLRTRGVGSREPRYSNATADGRAKNRRIEFDIVDERPQE
ncbi:MAG: OmpA family protein [Alphaproteobacteria bacterium]|nr:OmpA family protein [Alphaproteobacteria bacterium]